MPHRRPSSSPPASSSPLVIIGAGVIGTSTAYWLSLLNPNREIHILESSPTIFPSASARAGGFLAKDWFSSSVADLGILSFDLHKTLAERHEGPEKWGYAGSVGLSLITRKTAEGLGPAVASATRGDSWLNQNTSRADAASGTMTPVDSTTNITDLIDLPKWLSIASKPQLEIISQPDSTAQIDSGRFCNFLMGECIARGVHLHLSTSATRVLTNPDTGAICAVELSTGITVPCSQLLVTAGVWTPTILRSLFPNINHTCPVLNVSSLAGYSIVYRSQQTTNTKHTTLDTPPPSAGLREKSLCHAIFATDENANFSPELFSRHAHNNEQEIYLAGLNTPNLPFPPLATDIPVPSFDDPNIQHLHKVGAQIFAANIAGVEDVLEVTKIQLCHRPVLPDGKPIMGRIPDEQLGLEAVKDGGLGGVYTCVGHGPWGIALAPGSGLVMAEILEGKPKTSAHVGLLSVEHAVAHGSPLGSPISGIL